MAKTDKSSPAEIELQDKIQAEIRRLEIEATRTSLPNANLTLQGLTRMSFEAAPTKLAAAEPHLPQLEPEDPRVAEIDAILTIDPDRSGSAYVAELTARGRACLEHLAPAGSSYREPYKPGPNPRNGDDWLYTRGHLIALRDNIKSGRFDASQRPQEPWVPFRRADDSGQPSSGSLPRGVKPPPSGGIRPWEAEHSVPPPLRDGLNAQRPDAPMVASVVATPRAATHDVVDLGEAATPPEATHGPMPLPPKMTLENRRQFAALVALRYAGFAVTGKPGAKEIGELTGKEPPTRYLARSGHFSLAHGKLEAWANAVPGRWIRVFDALRSWVGPVGADAAG